MKKLAFNGGCKSIHVFIFLALSKILNNYKTYYVLSEQFFWGV